MHCPVCREDKTPTIAMTATGLQSQCPTCQVPFAPVEAEALPELAPVAAAPRTAKSTGPTSPLSAQIDAMRARLRFCEEQIAARSGFIGERDLLTKMLAIADPVVTEVVAPPPN
jgi:hypothetical protein